MLAHQRTNTHVTLHRSLILALRTEKLTSSVTVKQTNNCLFFSNTEPSHDTPLSHKSV